MIKIFFTILTVSGIFGMYFFGKLNWQFILFGTSVLLFSFAGLILLFDSVGRRQANKAAEIIDKRIRDLSQQYE